VGELIIAVGGQAVSSVHDIHRFLSESPIGQSAPFTIIRGQEQMVRAAVPVEALEFGIEPR
jgi:S1-C subfamily serine protease